MPTKEIREGAHEDLYTRMLTEVLSIIGKNQKWLWMSLKGGEKQINYGLPPGWNILKPSKMFMNKSVHNIKWKNGKVYTICSLFGDEKKNSTPSQKDWKE